MADRIDVNTDKLETMVRQLRTLQDKLEDVAGDLQSMNMSQRNGGEYRSRASIFLKNGSRISGSTARDVVRSAGRSANSLANYAGKLANSVQRVADLFESNENQIVEVADIDTQQAGLADFIAGMTQLLGNASTTSNGGRNPFEQLAFDFQNKQQQKLQEELERQQRRKLYDSAIKDRAENAIDPDVARLYDFYKDQISYFFISGHGKDQFNPTVNVIFINWEDDALNERGTGTTHFHEVGHMVDDYIATFGNASSSEAFTKALKADFDNYVKQVMIDNGYDTVEDAYEEIEDWLWDDMDNKNGVSDLCGGLSEKKAEGKWGHPAEYWGWLRGSDHGIPGKVNDEAFAHFFEASMSTETTKLDYLKEVFPTAYDEFKVLINKKLSEIDTQN